MKVKIIFPRAIAEILGVDRNYFDKPVANEKYIFRYGVDLNTKIHQLYIYSDLANYTFIGDVTAPILRVLSFESKRENNHLHQEFVNVHYVPVAKSFTDQVHISIKGDTGENVPFISGKTLVNYIFDRKNNVETIEKHYVSSIWPRRLTCVQRRFKTIFAKASLKV